MEKFVDENDCGWKVSVDSRSLIELIERISHKDILEKRNKPDNGSDETGQKTLTRLFVIG